MPLQDMADSGSLRDLKVWRDAMTLVEEVYRISARFPADERFGLIAQINDYQRILSRVEAVGRMLNGLIESLQIREELTEDGPVDERN